MDRLKFTLVGCGLAAVLTTSGCRNLRSEVPPGRSFSSEPTPGQGQGPAVGFSSDPHPNLNLGASAIPGGPGVAQGMPPEMAGQLGTPAPGASDNYGAPTPNAYGAPGTSGTDPLTTPAAASSVPPAIPDSLAPGTGSGLPAPAMGP